MYSNTSTLGQDECERERIGTPGAIQPHGVLLCVDPLDLSIVSASVNHRSLAELDCEILGRKVTDIWPALMSGDGERLFEIGDQYYVNRRSDAATLFIEIEPCRDGDRPDLAQAGAVARTIDRIRVADDVNEAALQVTDQIRTITGMERVVLYRFAPQGHGEVIAESIVDDWSDSLLGLNFPAADIPAQARELYIRNPSRFTPTRDYHAVKLVPERHPRTGEKFDLTHCALRSLSPMHRLYQRNLGVDGAMSLSIVREGQLWGMIIGHHRRPHRVPVVARVHAVMLCSCLAMRLTVTETAAERDVRTWYSAVHARMLEQIGGAEDFVTPLIDGEIGLLDLFSESCGAAVISGDDLDLGTVKDVHLVGQTPDAETVVELAAVCLASMVEGTFATDHIARWLPAFAAKQNGTSGMLAISVGEGGQHMIMWFLPERVRKVDWGGATHEQVLERKGLGDFLPRRSFERWTEEVQGHSDPWPAWQLNLARSLRMALNDVILRQLRTIRSLNTRLAESDRAKSQFLTHMSHELRTPLNAVLGFSDALRCKIYGPIPENQLECISLVHEAGTHLLNMINDVLDLSKIEAGKMTIDAEPVDLRLLTTRVISLLIGLARSKQIDLALRGDAVAAVVTADERLAKQMLLNLLSNALKFTQPGGRVTVAIDRPAHDGVRLTVIDTGIGIPLDQHTKVLEPFGQAHQRSMPDAGGTGLGLPIVKSLIELHGGWFDLESEVGVGTRASLHFPASALCA